MFNFFNFQGNGKKENIYYGYFIEQFIEELIIVHFGHDASPAVEW